METLNQRAAERHVLIPVIGPLEVLRDEEEAQTALQGPPITTQPCPGVRLFFSAITDQVNERASKLAGFTVQGDACVGLRLGEDSKHAPVHYLEVRSFRLSTSATGTLHASGHAGMKHPAERAKEDLHRVRRKSVEIVRPGIQDGEELMSGYICATSEDAVAESAWAHLPPELFMQIMKTGLVSEPQGARAKDAVDEVLPGNSKFILNVAAVCSGWRQMAVNDTELLRDVNFLIDENRPFNGQNVPTHMIRFFQCPPIPHLVLQASKAGNGSAALAAGKLLELQGDRAGAMRHWRKAAKAGFREAQLRVGEAFYKGSCNLPQDPEEAFLWLNRAVRGLPDAPPVAGKDDTAAKAFLILAFMYFDGEGLPTDQQEAVKHFKRAAAYGSLEAEKNLGSIYNSGQYGVLTRWQ